MFLLILKSLSAFFLTFFLAFASFCWFFFHRVFAVGLRLLNWLIWISQHLWWLGWVEVAVSSFLTVAYVKGTEFAVLGYGNRPRPSNGSNDIDSVADCALSTNFIVLLSIPTDLGEPGILTDHLGVFKNGFEPFHCWVFFVQFTHGFSSCFLVHASWRNVSAPSTF